MTFLIKHTTLFKILLITKILQNNKSPGHDLITNKNYQTPTKKTNNLPNPYIQFYTKVYIIYPTSLETLHYNTNSQTW